MQIYIHFKQFTKILVKTGADYSMTKYRHKPITGCLDLWINWKYVLIWKYKQKNVLKNWNFSCYTKIIFQSTVLRITCVPFSNNCIYIHTYVFRNPACQKPDIFVLFLKRQKGLHHRPPATAVTNSRSPKC